MNKIYISFVMILLIFTACKGNETPEKGSYSPLSKEECQTVQANLEKTFSTKFTKLYCRSLDGTFKLVLLFDEYHL